MTPVQSSNIKAVGYDPASRAMTVQFHSGATHRYDDVAPEHHAAMMAPGASVGSYFHKHIKSAHESRRIDEN